MNSTINVTILPLDGTDAAVIKQEFSTGIKIKLQPLTELDSQGALDTPNPLLGVSNNIWFIFQNKQIERHRFQMASMMTEYIQPSWMTEYIPSRGLARRVCSAFKKT